MNKPSDEIKERLDIVDVVTEYIQLKKAGANLKARCPFHNEKSPSFMVNPDKQIWHCFGCGKGGDMFAFVEEMDGVEFVDALRTLARKAGVELRRQDPKIISKRSKVLEVLELAAEFFHQSLLKSKSGEVARKYLIDRKITEKTISDFKLGYAPDLWDALINFLNKKGYQSEDILDAGLIIKREGREGYYDRFRNRLIFPIWDVQGNIIGFGGRMLPGAEDTQMAKYINSPQTQSYDKSKVLYGIDKAKMEIRKEDVGVVVEGYMDVISSHQAGVKNVVAASGTALTAEQVKLLGRYSKNIILSFDMDVAGDTAAKRGIDVALSADMNVRVAMMPDGMDPDDVVRKDVNIWKKVLKDAKAVMDYYFESALKDLKFDNVEDKKKASGMLLPIIAKISDGVERAHYVQKLAKKLRVEDNILFDYIAKISNSTQINIYKRPILRVADKVVNKDKKQLLSMQILSYLFNFPDFIPKKLKNIEIDYIHSDLLELYKKLKTYYNSHEDNFNYTVFVETIRREEEKTAELVGVIELYLHKDKVIKDLSIDEVENEIDKSTQSLKIIYLKNKMQEVERNMEDAEDAKNEEKLQASMLEFNKLSAELKNLNI